MTRARLVLALCAVLYVERFPIDDLAHVEVRVRLCTYMSEPHVFVDHRSYERLLVATGYVYRLIGSQDETTKPKDEWWRTVKDVRLFVTTEPSRGDPATGMVTP